MVGLGEVGIEDVKEKIGCGNEGDVEDGWEDVVGVREVYVMCYCDGCVILMLVSCVDCGGWLDG